METKIIADKEIIQNLTGKDYLNMILLHLDHKNCTITYEEDYTNFEITWWLPYYYKIKNIVKKN